MSGYACPYCQQPIRFIQEYQQWWCDRCQVYIPAAPQAAVAPAPQPTYDPAYQQPAYQPAPTAPATSSPPRARDPIEAAWMKTKEGWDKMADSPRREKELRVKGFAPDEIQLILRHGYTEEQVLAMRGSAKVAVPVPVAAPPPQVVVVERPAAPAQPQTTIIVKGDYVPSKSESRVEIKDSVVNRANVSGGGEGGRTIDGSVVSRSSSVGGTEAGRPSAPSPSPGTGCPNCGTATESKWKACPNCGLRLA